jgi:two-component system, chemotaxis family, protein-glutamate methylesterase/glutaminase
MSIEKQKIRVLIIDDSLFMRQMIADILNSDPEIEVVAVAESGEQGLEKIAELKPDVVTLDYEMPGLNGLATLRKIMLREPLPVVMISAYTAAGAKETLAALSAGAIDYVLKPSGAISLDVKLVKDQIINRVKVAAQVNLKRLKEFLKVEARKLHLPDKPIASSQVVAIGSSTGGTKVIELILLGLPKELPVPILIVQHMPEMFTKLFADRLNRMSLLNIKEAQAGDIVRPGCVYIAPGNWHMEVAMQHDEVVIVLNKKPAVWGLRPSVDVLLKSVARVYGSYSIGFILSGMGADGVEGMTTIKEAGGQTLAQDEKTSVVFGMPKRTIEAGVVDDVLPAGQMAKKILDLLKS